MMRVTTSLLKGEVAASSREQKKLFPSWKQQKAKQKKNFNKGGFRNQQRSERKQDRKKIQKEKRCSKGWRRVYYTGSETRQRLCPYTRMIQGVSHTTVAAEALKAVTKVPAREKQSLLLKNIITKRKKSKPKRQKSSIEDDMSQPWDLDVSAACPEALNQGAAISSHQRKKFRKEKRCSKGWRRVYYTGSETRQRLCPYTRTIQGVSHTIVAAEALKAVTKVPAREKQSLLLKNVITKRQKSKPKRQKSSIEDDLSQPWRDGKSTKEFVRRYKFECRDVKGSPECMKISVFMHEITNLELIKCMHDKIPKSVDEMMRVTTSLLKGEVAASSHEQKKLFPSWKQQKAKQKKNFKKGGFRNQQRSERKQDRFTLLKKTPKEILALDKGKFKPPPPMTTSVEKRNASKFYEFHEEVGHITDEYMHLKRQIKDMLKARKLSHLIKEPKQTNGKDQEKASKKGSLKKGQAANNLDGTAMAEDS
nr:reverse transcriptase domain-containing protein [Tanacetum cinerariifolium]